MIGLFPYRTLMKILFVFSLLLFVPLFESSQSQTIIQEIPTSFVMSIHSPQIQLTVDNRDPNLKVYMNITYINTFTGSEEKITPTAFYFAGSEAKVIDLPKPGTYLFEVRVDRVSELTIDPMGIYNVSLIIFFFVCIVNLVIFTRDYVIYMEN